MTRKIRHPMGLRHPVIDAIIYVTWLIRRLIHIYTWNARTYDLDVQDGEESCDVLSAGYFLAKSHSRLINSWDSSSWDVSLDSYVSEICHQRVREMCHLTRMSVRRFNWLPRYCQDSLIRGTRVREMSQLTRMSVRCVSWLPRYCHDSLIRGTRVSERCHLTLDSYVSEICHQRVREMCHLTRMSVRGVVWLIRTFSSGWHDTSQWDVSLDSYVCFLSTTASFCDWKELRLKSVFLIGKSPCVLGLRATKLLTNFCNWHALMFMFVCSHTCFVCVCVCVCACVYTCICIYAYV